MKVARLLVAIALLISPSVSARAAELLPKEMTGIRIGADATDCQAAERIFLVSASTVLIFERGSAKEHVVLGPASAMEGALLLARPGAEVILDTTFDKNKRCDRLPPMYYALFGEALALFEAFDLIARSCERGSGRDCLEAVFRFADVSENGELGRAEISRVLRALGFFVTYEAIIANKNDVTDSWQALQVPVEDLVAAAALTSLLSPFFSDNLLSSYDFDESGAVSLDEILQDRNSEDLVGALGTFGSAAAQTGLQVLVGAALQMLGKAPGILR